MVYDKVCLMLPTYGRSATYLPKFIETAINTASSPQSVCFAFCINGKDEDTKNFLDKYDWGGFGHEVIIENLPSPNLAKYFNMLYDGAKTGPGTVVTMMGDDFVFETKDWDRLMLDQINYYKGVGVFFCNDNYIAREKCCVNFFVTRCFVEATQHLFMADEFEAEMIDVVWTYVGKYTRTLHFYPDIVIRHDHNTRKPKDRWDSTFQRLNVVQNKVHAEGGKKRAKEIARKIADILIAKGLTGDSIC